MLWAIAVVLLILWVLGLVTGTTVGGFVHVLLVIAVVMVVVRIIQGRNPSHQVAPPSHIGFMYHGIVFKTKTSQSHPPPAKGTRTT